MDVNVLNAKLSAVSRLKQRVDLLDDSKSRACAREDWDAFHRLSPEHLALSLACEKAVGELCDWLQRESESR